MARFSLGVGERQVAVGPRGVRIGRAPGNKITLSDPMVCGHHAQVWMQGGQLYVRDEGSANGTRVNHQLIQQPCRLQVGDVIQVGKTVLTIGLSAHSMQTGFPAWLAAVFVIGLIVVGLVAILAGRRAMVPVADIWPGMTLTAQTPTAERAVVHVLTPTAPLLTATPLPPLERAWRATVYVEGDSGSGSGGVVDPRGYILTNYHVVAGESWVIVAVNGPRQDEPPETFYLAEVVAGDEDLDLALLRITADEGGRSVHGSLGLVTVPIGDSDRVNPGDSVRILGFPDVGGNTLTLVDGVVAGFHEDGLGHARGWIKADAEVSPGSSGGVAINQAGEWIGIPTWVSAEKLTLGRLSVLRPINLAQDLLHRIP